MSDSNRFTEAARHFSAMKRKHEEDIRDSATGNLQPDANRSTDQLFNDFVNWLVDPVAEFEGHWRLLSLRTTGSSARMVLHLEGNPPQGNAQRRFVFHRLADGEIDLTASP